MAVTKNGYDLFELLSALQKCIRRGMEYEAVHFAVELSEFGRGGPTSLWKRLKTVACEDIGCANPVMPILIDTLHKHYQSETGGLSPDEDYCRLLIVNAVVCLCRSPKTRITDDLLNVVYTEREFEGEHPEIPDFALDMHTKRGKEKGRGIDYFFAEGNKLENEAFENPYTEKAKELLKKYRKQ